MQRVARAGIDAAFVRRSILPDWWGPDCEADPSLLPDVEFMVARFLELPLDQVRDPLHELTLPARAGVHLYSRAGDEPTDLAPAIHAATQILSATVRNLRAERGRQGLPADPVTWRQELQRRGGVPDLAAAAADLWARGIPVVPVETLPGPRKFRAMVAPIDGHPAIAVAYDNDEPPTLLFWLAHEGGHIANGDCILGPVVDEGDPDEHAVRERRASEYGLSALSGGASLSWAAHRGGEGLARHADQVSAETGVDAGHLVLVWAQAAASGRPDDEKKRIYKVRHDALKALWLHTGGLTELRRKFDTYVDVDAASEDDRSLLRSVRLDPG